MERNNLMILAAVIVIAYLYSEHKLDNGIQWLKNNVVMVVAGLLVAYMLFKPSLENFFSFNNNIDNPKLSSFAETIVKNTNLVPAIYYNPAYDYVGPNVVQSGVLRNMLQSNGPVYYFENVNHSAVNKSLTTTNKFVENNTIKSIPISDKLVMTIPNKDEISLVKTYNTFTKASATLPSLLANNKNYSKVETVVIPILDNDVLSLGIYKYDKISLTHSSSIPIVNNRVNVPSISLSDINSGKVLYIMPFIVKQKVISSITGNTSGNTSFLKI